MGAALALWHIDQDNERKVNYKDDMKIIFRPEFNQNQIEEELKSVGANFDILDYENLISQTSDLSNEKAIGWFQGRMEFGPRALGRSILGDPRSEKMQKTLNSR